MSDRPNLQDLLEVQAHFGLPSPALVEKDWYVVKALAAVNSVNAAPFRLVFGGGTALSRAYGLTKRMSEDIDLKIVSGHEPTRPELRDLREAVTAALLREGFVFDPENRAQRDSRNESRHTIYQLPYPTETRGDGVLRPEIRIETSVWPLRLEPVTLSVTSFLAEAFKQPAEVPAILCSDLTETLAEKFVALTRRAGEEIAATGSVQDKTLVRHVFDLHATRSGYRPEALVNLALQIIPADAAAYGHKFPAYRDNPIAETLRAADALPSDIQFAGQYEEFLRDMVYGEHVGFETALATTLELAELLRRG